MDSSNFVFQDAYKFLYSSSQQYMEKIKSFDNEAFYENFESPNLYENYYEKF